MPPSSTAKAATAAAAGAGKARGHTAQASCPSHRSWRPLSASEKASRRQRQAAVCESVLLLEACLSSLAPGLLPCAKALASSNAAQRDCQNREGGQACALAKSGAAQPDGDQQQSVTEQPIDHPCSKAQHAQQGAHGLNLPASYAQHAEAASPNQAQQLARDSHQTQPAQHAQQPATDSSVAQQAQQAGHARQAVTDTARDLVLPILKVLTTSQELKLHVMTACQLVERAVGSRTAVAAVSGMHSFCHRHACRHRW